MANGIRAARRIKVVMKRIVHHADRQFIRGQLARMVADIVMDDGHTVSHPTPSRPSFDWMSAKARGCGCVHATASHLYFM